MKEGGIYMKKVRLLALAVVMSFGIVLTAGMGAHSGDVIAHDPGYGDID